MHILKTTSYEHDEIHQLMFTSSNISISQNKIILKNYKTDGVMAIYDVILPDAERRSIVISEI